MSVKILIIDDHKVFSESLKTALETQDYVVRIANEATVALKYIDYEVFDVVITDIEMPNMNGVEFLKKVREKKIEKTKYIVLTSIAKNSIFKQLLRLDIDGFLTKNVSQLELITVIKKVLNGEKYYEKGIYDSYLKANNAISQVDFTKRELDVLQLILEEKTTSEIAEELQISTFTVEGHRKNLLQKTNSKNVVGLIKYSILNHLA